jgi:hypothetical protein
MAHSTKIRDRTDAGVYVRSPTGLAGKVLTERWRIRQPVSFILETGSRIRLQWTTTPASSLKSMTRPERSSVLGSQSRQDRDDDLDGHGHDS